MKTLLRSQDLSCPSCVAKIEKALQGLEGSAPPRCISTPAALKLTMIRP